jgi:hypothetical protein
MDKDMFSFEEEDKEDEMEDTRLADIRNFSYLSNK